MTPQKPVKDRTAIIVAFASLAALTLASGGHNVAVVGMIPITESMGWSRTVPSMAYAVAILGMGAGGILMGRWSDRVGVAKPVGFGVCSIVLGSLWAAHAQTRWEFLIANGILIGLLGNAAFFAPLMANTTRWFTARRGIAVGIVSAGQSLGGALWPPLHRLVMDVADWRSAYLVYGLAVLVLCPPFVWLLRHRPPAVEVASVSAVRPGTQRVWAEKIELAPGTLHVVLCLAIVGCCVAMSMPMVHVIAHASDLGHPASRAAEVLALLLLASFVSRFLWGALSDRIGGLPTLALSSACQAVMLGSFLVVESLVGLYVVGALYGLAYGGIVPTYSMIAREHFSDGELGWRIGVIYLFGTIGMAAGGVVGGFIFDQVGHYQAAFAVGLAFNIANLALVVPLMLRERGVANARAVTERA